MSEIVSYIVILCFSGLIAQNGLDINKLYNSKIIDVYKTTSVEYASSTGFKKAYPAIGMTKYKQEVAKQLKDLELFDVNEYKITATLKILSTGIIQTIEIQKAPSSRHSDQIKKIFRETSSWFPAKKDGAFVDNEVKITVKVK